MIRNSSIELARKEIQRFALVARQHGANFSRVEFVPLDTPEAPRSGDLALPPLAASDADAAACSKENDALARTGAKYRWAC